MSAPLIIGDRLNTANRSVREAILRNDQGFLKTLAKRQIANGATWLDIAASASGIDELCHAEWIKQSTGATSICIDTQSTKVLRALAQGVSNPILNCYSRLLQRKHDLLDAIAEAKPSHVIALCLDADGTRVTSKHRAEIANQIADELATIDIPPSSIIFDPVTMPSTCGIEAESVTLETMELLRETFPSSGVLAAVSNYSFGSKKRRRVEREYLTKAKSAGATTFLLNALDAKLCEAASIPTKMQVL